ncbi:hypothetical protein [Vibrio gallaecicus]|nr:hypothetical protein [Vibrio gallaecicus]MDN3617452.1 hypothetical protein [Vibrio gallaecicus]
MAASCKQTNKAFKTDSQRSAFSVQVSFGVYGDKVLGRVVALLTT